MIAREPRFDRRVALVKVGRRAQRAPDRAQMPLAPRSVVGEPHVGDRGVARALAQRHGEPERLAVGTLEAVAGLPRAPFELHGVEHDVDVGARERLEVSEPREIRRLRDHRGARGHDGLAVYA